MPFTVKDFQDLLKLLQRHPEWRQSLWATLAGEELLRLPVEFRAFREEAERRFAELREEVAAARAEADRRFAELAEALRRHYEEFAAFRAETDRRFAELREEVAAARAEADRRFGELAEEMRKLAEAQRRTEERLIDIEGRLRGDEVEAEYRKVRRRYRHLVRDPHILSREEQEALLQELEQRGAIEPEEAAELEAADAIVRGGRWEGEREVYLVVEISATVHTGDVERAARRAAALRKALPEVEVLAVVAGPTIHPRARAAARGLGVWWLTDGLTFAPEEIPAEPLEF